MSKQEAQQQKEIMVQYEIDGNEIKLTPSIVQNYIVGNGTNINMQEFKLFTELCKVRKLNPFLKEAYLIKYTDKQPAQIVVGKDAILKRAVLNKQYNGREQGIIVQKEDGSIEERKGTFKLPNEQLVGAWAKVFRKDWEHPTYISVSFDEVAQRKGDGTLNSNWASKSATMVEKVALVRALRETFVEDLGGMVDADEVWQEPTQAREVVQETVVQDDVFDADAKVVEEPQQAMNINDIK